MNGVEPAVVQSVCDGAAGQARDEELVAVDHSTLSVDNTHHLGVTQARNVLWRPN